MKLLVITTNTLNTLLLLIVYYLNAYYMLWWTSNFIEIVKTPLVFLSPFCYCITLPKVTTHAYLRFNREMFNRAIKFDFASLWFTVYCAFLYVDPSGKRQRSWRKKVSFKERISVRTLKNFKVNYTYLSSHLYNLQPLYVQILLPFAYFFPESIITAIGL